MICPDTAILLALGHSATERINHVGGYTTSKRIRTVIITCGVVASIGLEHCHVTKPLPLSGITLHPTWLGRLP